MTTTPYLVGDLAERLCLTGEPEELALLHRQLRHWTLAGLLKPVGRRHAGKGTHRRYSESELLKPSLLAALVRDYKLPVGTLEYVARTYDSIVERGWPAHLKPERILTLGRQYYCALPMKDGIPVGGLIFGLELDALEEAFRQGAETALVVDWTAVLRRAAGEKPPVPEAAGAA